MNGWQVVGDRDYLQVEWCLEEDPDSGHAATSAQAASWGAFRLWVHGHNLCQYQVGGEIFGEVRWYLLPLLQWLAANWNPLLHEGRFPELTDGLNARQTFDRVVGRIIGDTSEDGIKKNQAWQDWWRRHALRSCRQGGVFPDIFFCRVLDWIEISWGNESLPGMPDNFYFTAPMTCIHLPPEKVAEPLYGFLQEVTLHLWNRLPADEVISKLWQQVNAIPDQPDDRRAFWYLEGSTPREDQKDRGCDYKELLVVEKDGGVLFNRVRSPLVIQRFSPVDIMFGSVSPQISVRDAGRIVMCMLESHGQGPESPILSALVGHRPLEVLKKPYDEGYELAMDLLDYFGWLDEGEDWIDLDIILKKLGIKVVEVHLEESNIRGLAVAGSQWQATLMVNTAHVMNRQEGGKRFTVAHELCHVLHDRLYGHPLALASGPWAPVALEKRANAFASMLLMPYRVVNLAISSLARGQLATREGVQQVADRLQTSHKATMNHLKNLGKISHEEYECLVSEEV